MMGKKTSNALREEVLRRSRLGDLQKQIARDLKLSVTTIQKIEAQAGLRRHPGYSTTPEQERAVLALFLAGHGQPHICQALGIPPGPVRECMARARGRQTRGQTGYQYAFSKLELRALRRDVREAQRKARRAVAKKWDVTLLFVEALEGTRREKAHERIPFLPKSIDLLRLLRTLLPTGIPFDCAHDSAALDGLMQGVGTFISLPTKYAEGLRSRFSEGLALLRREESGEWIH